MRIVCTVTNDLSHDQRMHRICTTLAGAGHEVTLVGRLLPGSKDLPSLPYRTVRIKCRYHKGKAFYVEYNIRLWQTLRKWNFDALCSVDLDTMIAGYWLRSRKRKWVFDAHEWFSETPEVVNRRAVRAFWRQVGRRLAPLTDTRYTVGLAISERMEEEYQCDFSVIRNLPNKTKYTNRENSGGVILYQGMLNPGRGIEYAISALAGLPENQLWIIGDGPERPSLQRLSVGEGVADRVIFYGYVASADLPKYTARAWLGLNLLERSSPSYYYSLANKALDYVQAGLPSVQMDYPEYRHINNQYDCFALLSELDSDKLVEIVERLNTDTALYARLRDNCQQAANELCWENEAPKLVAIYESLYPTPPREV